MLGQKPFFTPPSLRSSLLGRIGRNLAYLLGGEAAAGLMSLVYLSLAARLLGPKDYGVLMLAYGFALLVSSAIRIQPGPAIVRFGAVALADGRPERIVDLWRGMARVEFAASGVATATAVLLSAFVGPRLGWNGSAQGLATFAGLVVLGHARSTPTGILQLFGRFDLLAVQTAIGRLVRLAGVLMVLVFDLGLGGALLAWLATVLADWGLLWAMGWVVVRTGLPQEAWARRSRRPGLHEPKFWRFVAATNVDLALHELTTRLPSLTVGWFLGPAAAGLYAVGEHVSNVLAQPANLFGNAAYAELARHLAAGEGEAGMKRSLLVAARWTFAAVLPLLAVVLLFARQIVTAFAGPDFAEAGTIVSWLAIAGVLRLAVPALSSVLLAQGKAGRSLFASVVANLALYPLLPLLLVSFALNGAGVHAVVQALTALTLLATFAFNPPARPIARTGPLARQPGG